MAGPTRAARPQAVLFACGMNSVRSPMAAALFKHYFGRTYVGSAGVRKGELDLFAVAAMEELGLDIGKHKPMTFEELEDWEGLNFDLIVTLSPEAHHKALELTRAWPAARRAAGARVARAVGMSRSGASTAGAAGGGAKRAGATCWLVN